MIAFLVIAVCIYSALNVFDVMPMFTNNVGNFNTNSSKASSGLALLIQYTNQLSNYLLFFTMSIWEIKGQAVSLERVRPFVNHISSVENRINSS